MAAKNLSTFQYELDLAYPKVEFYVDPPIAKIEEVVRIYSNDTDWLPTDLLSSAGGKPFSQYFLCGSQNDLWYAVLCVWLPGATTPIHDHGGWGVVGVLEGEERTIIYRRKGDGETNDDEVSVTEGSVFTCKAKETTTFIGGQDVHKVVNSGEKKAISLHVYEKNLGVVGRNQFDEISGEVTLKRIPYDNSAQSKPR